MNISQIDYERLIWEQTPAYKVIEMRVCCDTNAAGEQRKTVNLMGIIIYGCVVRGYFKRKILPDTMKLPAYRNREFILTTKNLFSNPQQYYRKLLF
jgi:hypothetical protein